MRFTEIGTPTPPFGLSLFLLCNMIGLLFSQPVRAMLPFYPALLLTLLLLTLFPQITVLVPSLLR